MTAPSLEEEHRRLLAHRLRRLHPELRTGSLPGSLTLELGPSRVVLIIESAAAEHAQVRGRIAALRYAVEGALAPNDAVRARAILLEVGASLLRIEALPHGPRVVSSATELDELGPGQRGELASSALADPSLLVDAIDRHYRASLDGEGPGAITGLPPCLSIDARPEAPITPLDAMTTPLVAPCDTCGAAARCPANQAPRDATSSPLRPLRHIELGSAALAAVATIASAFGHRVPSIAIEMMLEIQRLRAGIHALPAHPFELSLKRRGDRVEPSLRIVAYSPKSPREMPSRLERNPSQRRALVALAQRFTTDSAASASAAWLATVESAQSDSLDLSLGFEIDLATEATRAQLYAHVESSPRARATTLIERTLDFAGARVDDSRAILDLHALGVDRAISELVLAAHSPTRASPRRSKLYFARSLSEGHAPSNLEPPTLGAFAPFAPSHGLAVLVVEDSRVAWEKWDFPCARHFQRASGLVEAFADGLVTDDAARVRTILDGSRFAPWPTWLSVGTSARTLYFVPR